MKKKFLICSMVLSVVASLAFFAACDGDDSSSSSGSSTTSGSTTTQPSVSFTPPAEPITIAIRSESAKITDSGRANQKMDKVLLSNYFSVKAAYQAGYTRLHVTVDFEAREIDDGYQYVFLYADKNCKGGSFLDKVIDQVYDPEDPSLLYTYRFEHGGTSKNTKWGAHSFTTTISMNLLKDDLYIRYGASGNYDDDWENRNVSITVEVAK